MSAIRRLLRRPGGAAFAEARSEYPARRWGTLGERARPAVRPARPTLLGRPSWAGHHDPITQGPTALADHPARATGARGVVTP
ncbi:hypothetical protein FRAAL6771 [Frankia alni ACN14a]|uniref:Uncharacterized protein n=1 Tax=Frankia alni (strain DSM 45986 / CECT 9034 / ACN14a) TaxID=326424 RepID=Q0RAZ4_FRAAA|nr:hypothetical protein FRAAL6771 [Frankia alni ACN14a]